MLFRTFQECREADGWQPVRIPSESVDRKFYTVHVNPWGADQENICECLGYIHHGYCKHQKKAADKLCTWNEDKVELQTDQQHEEMICPRCGGPTKWQVEAQ